MHQFVKQMTPSVDHRVGTCLKVQTRITEKEGNKTNCVSHDTRTTGANLDYLTNFRKRLSFSADFAIFAGELADLLKDIAPGFGDSL